VQPVEIRVRTVLTVVCNRDIVPPTR
jgi:hypothetical protein